MTATSGKAEAGARVPDGIDLDAQIIHARGIYEGDCETFGKQSQWAIKSGSILASLFELKDARGKSCSVVSEEMITAYLNAQAKSVHEAESNFQLIRPRKHCAEGLRAALSFTAAANGPGEAVAEILRRKFISGSRVTNCLIHTNKHLTERPKDCELCRTDLENQLSFAICVNEFLNKQVDDIKAAMEEK